MKTTVLLACYNGEKYIYEQLQSIYNQTLTVDEVIIKDDCSADNTISIVNEFIKQNGLTNTWKLIVNQQNVGWRTNFVDGLKMVTGDLIFLSDQDDIWLKSKVEKSVECMKNSDIKLLVTDFIPLYEKNASDKIRIIRKGYRGIKKINNDIHFREVIRPGCTYCFRKELIDYIDVCWFSGWAHDSFLWTMASVKNGLYILCEPLVIFRRHGDNNTPSNEKTSVRRLEIVQHEEKVLEVLLKSREEIGISGDVLTNIRMCKKFNSCRIQFLKKRNLSSFVRLLKYLRFYPKIASLFGDVISCIR